MPGVREGSGGGRVRERASRPIVNACVARARRVAPVLTVIVAFVPMACPGQAAASVTLGPQQIVVEGEHAGALITRAPFRMSFTDADGHTVLSEVAAQNAGLTLPPPSSEGSSQPAAAALYAPLSFLVGTDTPSTRTFGQFAGDLAGDEESGTEYSAQAVLAAAPDGDGVRLTLSTDDPSGRQLSVEVTPDGDGAIRVSATPGEPAGVAAMADSFDSTPGEAFHGFGGRHNALDQHGQSFYDWVDQENLGEGPQEDPGETGLTPNGPQGAYYVQSSFVSNRGYGFLLAQNELSSWRLDSTRPDAWQSEVAAPQIDYVVAPGSLSQATATLTSSSGRQRVPPDWALGPMLDREVELFEEASPYEQQIESDLREIAALQLPLSAYRIEGWAFLSRPFLESVIARLKALGIRPLVYFRSFVGGENIGTEYAGEYATALEHGYLATNAGGQPYTFSDNFLANAGVIDFTKPAAVQWWRERIDAALELGAEGFMLDFGEQVQPGMHFSDGSTGTAMHNRYPVLVQKLTREIVDEYEQQHPGRSIAFFTRSGYSGQPGSAAYESFNFPGDETTDWSQASGLASLTRDMLNRAVGGAYGYGTDIGGYDDLQQAPTTRELFLRWTEWAALSPIFRLHGALREEHPPWAPTIDAVDFYKRFSELHIAAEPLISALWKQADETGVPVTRPLYMAYPEDPQAALQDQEWLLGADVLVAPVVQRGASSRTVYVPSGCWGDPESGQQVVGPRYETVPAGDEQLPFFFRCDTRPFTPPGAFAAGHTFVKALSLDTVGLPGAVVGRGYAETLNASGGATPFRWSIVSGALPSGLHLDPATGAILGTPTTAETASFTAQVTDAGSPAASVSTSLSITVQPAPTVSAEYGRCVAHKQGRYTDAGCHKPAARRKGGRYEWRPAPEAICVARAHGQYKNSRCGLKAARRHKGHYELESFPTFTAVATNASLSTDAGQILCPALTASGEITGARSGREAFTLTGCELAGQPCTSVGANGLPSAPTGVIDSGPIDTTLVGPAAGKVLVELTASSTRPYLLEFDCAGTSFRVFGSLSGVQAGDVDGASTVSTTTFLADEGEQALYTELSGDEGSSWGGAAGAQAVATLTSTATSGFQIRT